MVNNYFQDISSLDLYRITVKYTKETVTKMFC